MTFWQRIVAFFLSLIQPMPKPAPAPPPGTDLTQALAKAILAFNNSRAVFRLSPVYHNASKGVTIHKIDAPTALLLAHHLLDRLDPHDATLPFCMAVGLIGSESAFDPAAENDNLGLTGSNPSDVPGGYDVGLCQLKLRYVDPDPVKARAIALDPIAALIYFASDVREHLTWADVMIAASLSGTNRYWLAVGAYKYGKTGILGYIKAGGLPRNAAGKTEIDQVADVEKLFAKALGLPTVLS